MLLHRDRCFAVSFGCMFGCVCTMCLFFVVSMQLFMNFVESVLSVPWRRGHLCMLPEVDPTLEDVYGENARDAFLEQARSTHNPSGHTFCGYEIYPRSI